MDRESCRRWLVDDLMRENRKLAYLQPRIPVEYLVEPINVASKEKAHIHMKIRRARNVGTA